MPTTTELPSLPSALILLALDDLEKTEKDQRYTISMRHWHNASGVIVGGKCAVCLAGAVMAQSLGAPIDDTLVPNDFIREQWPLRALDLFRRGGISNALNFMGIDLPAVLPPRLNVTPYFESPERFKSDMRDMAALLASYNL